MVLCYVAWCDVMWFYAVFWEVWGGAWCGVLVGELALAYAGGGVATSAGYLSTKRTGNSKGAPLFASPTA